MARNSVLSSVSRRSFLQLSTAASIAAAFGVSTEAALARDDMDTEPAHGAVMINANETRVGHRSKRVRRL